MLTDVSILHRIFSFKVYSQCPYSVHFVKKQMFSVLNSHLCLVFIVLLWVHLVCSKPRDWHKFSYSSSLCFFLYCSHSPPKRKLLNCVLTAFYTSTEHQNDYKLYYYVAVIFYAGYINFNVINIYFLCLSALLAWSKCPTHLALTLWCH
jgi:hypothetical protein